MQIEFAFGPLQSQPRRPLPVLLAPQRAIDRRKQKRRAVVVRSELGGAFEELGRPLEIALLEEEAGIEIIGLVQVGIERKRTLEFGYRPLMASTKLKSQSA